MNKRKRLKWIMIGAVFIFLVGFIGGIYQYKMYQRLYYRQIASVVGYASERTADEEQEWMLTLKNAGTGDVPRGAAILEAYGYTEKNIVQSGANIPFWYSVCIPIGASLIVALAGLWYWFQTKRKNEERIQSLTDYLVLTKEGKEGGLLQNQEDEYAFLQDEIYKTVSELYQTRDLAIKERGILKDHLADIAHQLKTPLTSMGLMCELLEESVTNAEKKMYTKQIQKQLMRLDELVHSLLILSKIEANVVQMSKDCVQVYILIFKGHGIGRAYNES